MVYSSFALIKSSRKTGVVEEEESDEEEAAGGEEEEEVRPRPSVVCQLMFLITLVQRRGVRIGGGGEAKATVSTRVHTKVRIYNLCVCAG